MGSATPAAAQNEAQALANAIGRPLPKFPEGEDLQALVKAAAAHPLGSADNPVRLGSIRASYLYIGRLRCADGSRPAAARTGTAAKLPFGRLVDAYRVDCGRSAPGVAEVHIDAYHAGHDEDRAPPGLILSAASAQPPGGGRPR
jgi:hypothetical protein